MNSDDQLNGLRKSKSVENNVADVVSTMQLSTNNDLYHD